MTQPLAGAKSVVTENELDIRGLFRVLWAGKLWIAGIALGFALLALAYTFFAKQEWSATAITDRPTVNMLGGYYSQQQFLRNLDIKANLATPDQASVMDEAYKEFVMQLASWDTRRDFWSQTDYYKQRMVGNSKADAAFLDDLHQSVKAADQRADLVFPRRRQQAEWLLAIGHFRQQTRGVGQGLQLRPQQPPQ